METIEVLQSVIEKRRSIKSALLNGKKIPDEIIMQLLQLADWAPTHAHTEPWRFIVYSNDAVKEYCAQHAELYKASIAPENFQQATYDKLKNNGNNASHIIVAYCKRGNNPKITQLEEIAATCAATEHILLGASALNIAVLWSTGGMFLKPQMKEFFGLAAEDVLIANLFMGYTNDDAKKGTRITPLEEKIKWHK